MKILVLTDNIVQYERFKELVVKKQRNNVTFEIRHSSIKGPIWEHEDFFGNQKMLDVKVSYDEIIKQYDLVLSLHCKQLFPKYLVQSVRCINIHPGYNPVNRGWYPQVFALINNLPIGATIHEMDEYLDHGPIIAREFVEKYSWDTSESLYQRILRKEIELLDIHFDSIIDNTYKKITPESDGNIFLKQNFKEVCKIDPGEVMSFGACIDRLRALTHSNFYNAYFVDENTGKKIYVKLDLFIEK
jgi:methionyl-tRNA formyltransferase